VLQQWKHHRRRPLRPFDHAVAFKNLRRVHHGNRFIAPYIDTAFNDCLFM